MPIDQKNEKQGRKKQRYPFVDGSYYFRVPIRLFDDGIAAGMTGLEFTRYITYLRVANFDYGNAEIKTSFTELQRLDGVSTRSAYTIVRRLLERGLICIARTTPLTITLVPPSCWREAETARPVLRREHVTVRTQVGPKSWEVVL